jgi:hypothetical protein
VDRFVNNFGVIFAIASTPYQQVLAVFDTAETSLRAKDVCRALGAGVTAKDTRACAPHSNGWSTARS